MLLRFFFFFQFLKISLMSFHIFFKDLASHFPPYINLHYEISEAAFGGWNLKPWSLMTV